MSALPTRPPVSGQSEIHPKWLIATPLSPFQLFGPQPKTCRYDLVEFGGLGLGLL